MTESVTDILRRTIKECGESYNSISKASGVPQPTVSRFMNGAEIKSGTLDALAAHFGLTFCKEAKRKKK